ncbi:GNAT family N-acetyltransferase [Flavobacteriaceae bacterium F08102]|nr:GNAT family N-acetyltransferase [Flavobacteriaceae bacterium F08102]
MAWFCLSFNELSTADFHDIIQLRNAVFVVEQQCIFQDLDGKDKVAYHLFFKHNHKIVAYARLFKPGVYYNEASIGRIVVEKSNRKNKLGRALLAKSIKEIERLFGKVPIKIGAQTYLQNFYESFDFFQIGEPYLEDGIPHMYMLNNSLL